MKEPKFTGKYLIVKEVVIANTKLLQIVDSTHDAVEGWEKARELGKEHMIINASAIEK